MMATIAESILETLTTIYRGQPCQDSIRPSPGALGSPKVTLNRIKSSKVA